MSWLIPLTQLDNEQKGILQSVRNSPGKNFWITGYAGSGKSVLLIHIALNLKERNPNARIAIVGFTRALVDQLNTGIPFELKQSISLFTVYGFMQDYREWDFVLVDEVQDLKHDFFVKLSRIKAKVIAAGDMNQSIYDNTCPEADIIEYLDLDIRRLNIIHRLSRSGRRVAAPFCNDKAGFMSASLSSAVELRPSLVSAKNRTEELKWLSETAEEYARKGYQTAILLPTHEIIKNFIIDLCRVKKINAGFVKEKSPVQFYQEYYEDINFGLRNAGLNYRYLGNGAGDLREFRNSKQVLVMTWHSSKGLDFEVTFLPFLTSDATIYAGNKPAETLFFVALTRAREQMFLSYSNLKHRFLGMIDSSAINKINAAAKSGSNQTLAF
ncbi:MAG: hypothetical protein B6D45_12165 [Ignavibacteriales bacterium UTCHB3]|nr:MAG: hypothetical protein B6D45_12165 [Ignavibacteriales bacterium UTCHB3]